MTRTKTTTTLLALLASGIVIACTTHTETFTTTTGGSNGGASDPTTDSPQDPSSPIRLGVHSGRAQSMSHLLGELVDGGTTDSGTTDSGSTTDSGTTDGGTADSGTSDGGAYSVALSTDKTSYAYGESVSITFGSMSGGAGDWVGIAPAGSPSTEYSWYSYTMGATDGTASMPAGDFLPPGTYVARAFFADSYTIQSESAAFTVGAMAALTATASTDKSAYGGFEPITVTFSGLSGATDTIVTASPTYGSTGLPYGYVNAGPLTDGTVQLGDLLAGTYEIRVFEGTDWKGTSTTFTVSPAVATDKTSYTVGEPIVVSFAGMQGLSLYDSVAIADFGSAHDTFVIKQNVDWYWSGTRSFDSTSLPTGNYVARIFFDFDNASKVESTEFTVVSP